MSEHIFKFMSGHIFFNLCKNLFLNQCQNIFLNPHHSIFFTPCFWWDPCYSYVLFLCCVFLFVLFVFVLCLVYPMLPVSLDCSFLIAPCFVCLRPVSCVPNVASFSGLFFLDCPLFCLSSSCVLCTQCCQFLWIVLS